MDFIGRQGSGSNSGEFSIVQDNSYGASCHFTLSGQVSTNEAAFMESSLEKAMQQGCTNIVVNMCLVSYFSSAGIRVVLSMYKRLKNKGGKLQIENPSENVKNVIGMTALDELLLK